MVTNTEPNVVFDNEDTRKIELVKARLTVLQNEVLGATKGLAELEEATVQAQRNKQYAEEQFDFVDKQLKDTQDQLVIVKDALSKINIEIERQQKEHREAKDTLALMSNKHSERETHICKKEEDLKEQHEHHSKKEKHLSERELAIKDAEAAFLKALQSVKF